MKKHKSLIVGVMKNEGPYVLEWVAYHRALGFDHIMIFTNDCTDGTNYMLERLSAMGHAIHLPNPKSVFGDRLGPWNNVAFRYSTQFQTYKDSDYVCAIDCDEFIEVKTGDNTLAALYEKTNNPDVISLTVAPFNSSNLIGVSDTPVIDRFTTPAKSIASYGQDAPLIQNAAKSIMRTDIPKAAFRNHRPKIDNFSSMDRRWVDGSGNQMPAEFTNKKINTFTANHTIDYAQVNHLSIKSAADFLVKTARGDVVTADRLTMEHESGIDNSVKYWNERNINLDNPAHKMAEPPEFRALLAEFHKDSILGDLHKKAQQNHIEQLAFILTTPLGQRLASEIGYPLN